MKKVYLILIGIITVLLGIIFIVYKTNISPKEDVIELTETKESNETISDNVSEDIFVDIKGAVQNPGIYKVDKNTRVNDVIILSGGLLENADTSKINLAKKVIDEMTIYIYTKEEVQKSIESNTCICDTYETKNDACIESNIQKDLININTATSEELQTLPGIGESKAQAIIEEREKNGLFKSIEEVKNVQGIGEALFEKIKIYITV